MRVWRWVRWPVGVLVLVYIALVLYRIPTVGEKERTKDAVAYIHAQKITLSDVIGSNLPPPPNKQENDATVEGVDSNNNGIRDDVELVIFEKYPDSPRVRAAQLQYAMAVQMELTKVFNSETWKAAVWKEARGYFCLDLALSLDGSNHEEDLFPSYLREIDNAVLNTIKRQNQRDEVFKKHSKSNANPSQDYCDIDLKSLSS